ncbi:hypothetical protein [Streptomyces oceani]|uniref:Phosphoribosylglycinamide synthetase n=1 Tax=Streptomyces oceani TaxID=1075402 RepID=A0A1E7JY46_9ACTN|nr:hypothetical protein [Streptomyces oceani]OEU96546.1 hypothetical protein AN216_19925 [Streptomyces oceani]
MTESARCGITDSRRLLLVHPTPRLESAATEAGYHVAQIADTAGFTDVELRSHLRETVRAHRVGMLIACGEASTHPAVLETAEQLGVSPNPASAARLLADATEVRDLLNRSGPQWQALTSSAEPGGGPPRYDVEYGVETLTAEGMHRVTGIVELRFTGRRELEAAPGSFSAPADGYDAAAGDGVALHTFPAPITGPEGAEIRALATGLLDLVGYEFGYAFTRVARTEQGPRVVDALPRQAGWPASRLIELTTGLVAEQELVRALSGKHVEAATPVGYAVAVPLPDTSAGSERMTDFANVQEVRDGHVLLTALTPAELAVRTAAVLGRPV